MVRVPLAKCVIGTRTGCGSGNCIINSNVLTDAEDKSTVRALDEEDSAPFELVGIKINHWSIIIISDGISMSIIATQSCIAWV